jgi:outer membrane protein assembly factor BamE (lipoprotein component of BamABCDE complex)
MTNTMTDKGAVAAIRPRVRQLSGWESLGMMRLPCDTRKPVEASAAIGQPGRCAGKDARPARRGVALCAIVALGLALAACAESITKHGHQFQDNDLKSITTGMSQEQVRTSLGSPTTTATVGAGSAFYYISSTQAQTAFFTPVEKDRKVLAVYFNQLGSVDRVAHYGIKDGKVFNFAKQKTPTPSRDEGIIKALFRNLGAKQFGSDY